MQNSSLIHKTLLNYKGTERERQTSPCITEKTWHGILSRHGFSGSEFILRDYDNQICHETSVIVSSALPEPSSTSRKFTKIAMVMEPESPFQQSLAQKLVEILISERYDCQILSIQGAVSQENLDKAFCVSLLEVDKSYLHKLSAETFLILQKLVMSASHVL